MTSKEYMDFHKSMCDRMIDTTRAKNADYTGGGSPFKNFETPEFFGFATTEQGFLTRMCDKFARISTFVQKGILLVKDESVTDTLIDLANYCILFAGYLESKRQQTK